MRMSSKPFDHWLEDETLIVSGDFFGVSTGLLGGWKRVRYAFNHTVKGYIDDEVAYLRSVAKRYGLKNYFGLLTAVPMENLAIAASGEVTVFATAGVTNPNARIGTINIIAVLDCRVSRGAMLNAIITITEAKSHALLSSGYDFTGTSTDAVVVLSTQRGAYHRYSGAASELGKKIWSATRRAVLEGLSHWKR